MVSKSAAMFRLSHRAPKRTECANFPFRLAYLIFDGIIVLFISAFISIIFATAVPNAWWELGHLFVCLFLYGIASIHLSYTISLIAKSQLAAFAFSAGGQAYATPP